MIAAALGFGLLAFGAMYCCFSLAVNALLATCLGINIAKAASAVDWLTPPDNISKSRVRQVELRITIVYFLEMASLIVGLIMYDQI